MTLASKRTRQTTHISIMNLKKVYAFHADELGDIIVHFSEDGKPLFMEILRASKIETQNIFKV
jgi:hypothetical protein